MCEPLEVLAGRGFKRLVEIRNGAQVLSLAEVVDPLIGFRELSGDRFRGVFRSVVEDEEFPVRIVLGQNRFNGLPQIVFSVENGETETH